MMEIGDVMYTCGGITIENPEFQQCIKRMDSYDRVLLDLLHNIRLWVFPSKCFRKVSILSHPLLFDKHSRYKRHVERQLISHFQL